MSDTTSMNVPLHLRAYKYCLPWGLKSIKSTYYGLYTAGPRQLGLLRLATGGFAGKGLRLCRSLHHSLSQTCPSIAM